MPAIWFARFATLNEDAEAAAMELEAWQAIYEKDVAMMERSDIIIANLTPFAGTSADAGTLIEVGGFLGRGKSAGQLACGRAIA